MAKTGSMCVDPMMERLWNVWQQGERAGRLGNRPNHRGVAFYQVYGLINGDETLRTLEKLELIDALQRLGIDYLFKNEIERVLDGAFENKANNVLDNDLHYKSLYFRLLRQHGYEVSHAKSKDEYRELNERDLYAGVEHLAEIRADAVSDILKGDVMPLRVPRISPESLGRGLGSVEKEREGEGEEEE
ncbi:hypothetical protein Syun_010254 [Stephania yunnanensis]|uniref:Terpene synthase N-terminal domain-containing protein n=1 Tax=Stephania yunnanensis TaxID=152371 RepID=A0AAP0PRM0_9MAGN